MGLPRTLAILLLCQLVGYGFGQEVNVLSFGDFMEFHIGLHKACENNPGGQNTTWEIINKFAQCTRSLEQPQDKDLIDVHLSVCKSRGKYLDCWDKLKGEAVKRCGADKAPILPVVYRATAASVCGNDNGAARLGELKKAIAQPTPGEPETCPEEQQQHWIQLCQELLPSMHSPDLCTRHGAINTCLRRLSCDTVKTARLTNKLYSDGRQQLKCRN